MALFSDIIQVFALWDFGSLAKQFGFGT